jgi:hypothetical protein
MGGTSPGGVKEGLARPHRPDFACPGVLCAIGCRIPNSAAPATTSVSFRSRLSSVAWLAFPLLAIGFLAWSALVRVRRVDYVTGIAGWSVAEPASVGGLPGWQARLIVPEPNNASYEWLDQTRRMLARQDWRVRHVDYENAPFGVDLREPSPYRWWLGLLTSLDGGISGRQPGASLERAALVSDPLLHLLLVVGATLFVAWQFGAFPAALLSIALVALFPFAGEFIAGVPDDRGLTQACALGSLLPLLAGIRAAYSAGGEGRRRAQRWFFFAGIAGGAGLWVNVASQVPILLGIALGAWGAAWVARGRPEGDATAAQGPTLWRAWAFGGGAMCLAAYLAEYFPGHLESWQLRVNHPLYGLAWLGLGEILALSTAWIQRTRDRRRLHAILAASLAGCAVAALPLALRLTHSLGFLEADIPLLRLTRLPTGVSAPNFFAWISRDGPSWIACAAVLPLIWVGPAIALVVRRATGPADRALLAVSLGPVAIAVGFALRHLSWWNGLDGALLALLVTVTVAMRGAKRPRFAPWIWGAIVGLVLAPGVIQLMPPLDAGAPNALNDSEVVGLIERDLARWLGTHAASEKPVFLTPPNETAVLNYFAGLQGLATLGWENRDGIGAAIRIVSASTPEEALELIGRREITHIVIPSWDSYLLVYARMGLGQVQGTFLNQLHQWDLPLWLRPVPYPLPSITGFEGQSVTIFEVVDEQDDATAASRLAEYFVEMDHLDFAAAQAEKLHRFPANLSALVARAQVENAKGDTDAFGKTVALLVPRLSGAAERALPWDRRVALAIVLAQAKHFDPARGEVRQCLAEIDEEKLRSLPSLSLYRFQVLGKVLGMGITDPKLHEMALNLLPPSFRSRLEQ